MSSPYDALLLVSFGGPECQDDVMPFLRNVVRGRNVPDERLQQVAHHYEHFGGRSPINDQNRELLRAITRDLHDTGIDLPWYWGNRNWHPMLADTMQQMQADGRRRVLALVTSAYSSYSGCRQYREDIIRAQESVADAPVVDKIRVFFNHPEFVIANAERVQAAKSGLPSDLQADAVVAFTAHSIPTAMASNCRYHDQLLETCRLVAAACGIKNWHLVFQSRSGPPTQPWLEPDILDHIRDLAGQQVRALVISPIGFVSDHVEVLYDLDTEARQLCTELGLSMVRAETVGTHPRFIRMVRELIMERLDGGDRRADGDMGAWHDVCPVDCCRPAARPMAPS